MLKRRAVFEEFAVLFTILQPLWHIMQIASVVYEHITPSAAEHFHGVNVRLVSVDDSAEVFTHAVISVKASVGAVVPRLNVIFGSDWNRTEIVKVGVSVLLLLLERMADYSL